MVARRYVRRRRFVKKKGIRRFRRRRFNGRIRRRYRKRYSTKVICRVILATTREPTGMSTLFVRDGIKFLPWNTAWVQPRIQWPAMTHFRIYKCKYVSIPETSLNPNLKAAQDSNSWTTPVGATSQYCGTSPPKTSLKPYPKNKVYFECKDEGEVTAVNSFNGPVLSWTEYKMPTDEHTGHYSLRFRTTLWIKFYRFESFNEGFFYQSDELPLWKHPGFEGGVETIQVSSSFSKSNAMFPTMLNRSVIFKWGRDFTVLLLAAHDSWDGRIQKLDWHQDRNPSCFLST